jgi:tetratricopeptide (TPR) repeat protein
LSRRHYPEARSVWAEFVSQNPLDSRVPQILFEIGASFIVEQKYDQAITAWESLTSKFPDSEPAAHAQYEIASIAEVQKGKPAEAIEQFKKVAVEPWKGLSLRRIAVMESRQLSVVTPRAFRTGETPRLEILTRNLETLTFSAYKLNAEAYFRKKHAIANVEALDIGLVAPDAEWSVPVADFGKYKPIKTSYELAKLEVPGVYVVKVTDEKTLQATTLVIASDVDAIVKTSRDQFLLFVEDMKTSRGRAGARVLVSDGNTILLDSRTGDDGVLLHNWEDAIRDRQGSLSYLVLADGHVAGSGLAIPDKVAQGLTPRAYLYTDRPAYRPGQRVEIRGVVREVRDSQYANVPKEAYRFEVTDSRGRLLVARSITLSDFGTFHESLSLDSAAPVGSYQLRIYQPGKSDFSGQFEVQSYQLEPIDLTFLLDRTVFYRGETIEADVIAKYQYGAPVANRALEIDLPDGRILHVSTDPAGRYRVSLPTDSFAEEQTLRLVARLPQDNVSAAANLALAVRGFGITLHTAREVFLDGESFPLQITTTDAQGQPIGQDLAVAIFKLVTQGDRTTEREVKQQTTRTDSKTGLVTVTLRVDDEQGGSYLIRVSGQDRFGNPIVTDRSIEVSGQKDGTKLRLLADRQRFKVGEEAKVNLHSRGRSGTALLTWEADRILSYKVVSLQEGDNSVSWAIEGSQFPNFTLTASRMWENEFDRAQLDVQVERDLRVSIAPSRPTVGPGEPVDVEITTVDQLGRPVSAEISLALVDQALLRLHGDAMPAIGDFFYNQSRTGSFTTESTNTFRYAPVTTPVSKAVVDESERAGALAANAADRAKAVEEAESEIVLAPEAAPSPAGTNAPGMNGGARMMGGMGGMGAGGGTPGMPELGDRPELAAKRRAGDTWAEKRDRVEALGLQGRTYAFDVGAAGADEVRLRRLFDFQMGREPASGAVRQRFVETAYWNPSIVTGADGKAKITFKAPEALSQFRLTARGVTGSDTLVGQTTSQLTVRQDFFVDLKIPASLSQGDKPRLVAQVHHLGVSGKVGLRLSIYGGGKEDVYPRSVEIKGDGVDEVIFESIEVPDTDSMRLTLTGAIGERTDELVAEVPVRPWGVQAFASASGTSSDGATVFVGLPGGRSYEDPDMLIVLSPTLQRMLIELALDQDVEILRSSLGTKILPPPTHTTADRASNLLAASSVLSYLRDRRVATVAPEATRLSERIQGLVSELTASQNEDGGWPWVGAGRGVEPMAVDRPSDRLATAAVVWALASAEPLGLVTDQATLDRAVAWMQQELTKLNASDHDTRAALLHALSTRKAATFEQVNSLNRNRQSLSNAALGYLALTLANLDRVPLAGEVLDVLLPRAKSEAVAPGRRTRLYWEGSTTSNASPSSETTALVAFAFARVRPGATQLEQAVDWLLAHRVGAGWQPMKAKGAALAALAAFHADGETAEDRYRLVISVNDTKVETLDIQGATAGQVIRVPAKALKSGDANRIRFEQEGRGTFGYAVTLSGFTRDFGPDQDRERTQRAAWIDRRVYWPADPELDGKTLPVGFGVAVNPTPFENVATQVAVGGRARVGLTVWRNLPWNTPDWERDFLVVREHLPAGVTLIDGSVKSSATSYSLEDGVLTFYFAPDQNPGGIQYDVFGYIPGEYRALPASVQSAYEPGRYHLGSVGTFRVLAPGEPNTDSIRPTPDELYARGKADFDAGRFERAGESLEALFSSYSLRDDVLKDAARMLLLINIKGENPRKVVQYFEVVKEKAPEQILSFDQLLAIGKAYREINESERAMIVWRGLVEASYLEDARVGEVLRQKGKVLDSLAYLIDLWRSYPNTPSIESDFFGLSQVMVSTASSSINDSGLRRELAAAGVSRSELLLQTIRMIQTFLSQSPGNPLADEASLALLGAFLELEDHDAVVKLAARFASLYPRSTYLDSFQYSEALGNFHLGKYDRAIEVAEAIARATYKDSSGVEQPSPNKWQAIYILGQIYDARRQPGKALEYYRKVTDRFTDAAGAVEFFTRKDLKVAEVSVVRPAAKPTVAQEAPATEPRRGQGFRAVAAAALTQETSTTTAPDRPDGTDKPGIELDYRNIAQADVKVYPVDLMRLYLTRKNLDGIAGIDLAGITPLHEATVSLGDGHDYEDRKTTIKLPLTQEGAYLVMIRGDNLYASGIVLISPLELEILEEPSSGRVRITVRDARSKAPVPKVQVKVIGSDLAEFISGETDLRGVYVADGIRGVVTAVVRKGSDQYAFYRGTSHFGLPETPPAAADALAKDKAELPALNQALDANLKSQNMMNSAKQIERLQQRYQKPEGPAVPGAAAGEFR